MPHNPMEGVDKPKNSAPRNRRISDQEIAAIIAGLGYCEESEIKTTKQYMALAFLLALETAMRQGEIMGLQWSLVNFAEKKVLLPDTKNGSAREVPLSKRAIELLRKLQGNHAIRVFPINQASASTLFLRTAKELGIQNLTFHDSRHEATTRLARNKNIDSITLAKITGHQDPRSLMIYYNPTATELAELLD